MLRIYKNALLQAIREAGFDPRDFEANETYIDGVAPRSGGAVTVLLKHNPAYTIVYHEGDLHFTIRNNPDDSHTFDFAHTRFTPTYARFPFNPGKFHPSRWVKFDEVLPSFQEWLREEVSQAVEDDAHPDVWAQLSSQGTVATDLASARSDDSTFSVEERAQIQIAVREFRLLVVKTFDPGQAELQIVNERLDYLSQAVQRLNRFDWQGVAIQTVIGIATTLSLDTNGGRVLWGLFQQAMSSVVHLLGR